MPSDPKSLALTAPVPPEVVLACRGVTKIFGDHAVLRGADLDVGQHKAVVMLAPRVVHKLPASAARERAMDLLGRVGLADKAPAYPDRLSGGRRSAQPSPAPLLTSRGCYCSTRSPAPSTPSSWARCSPSSGR